MKPRAILFFVALLLAGALVVSYIRDRRAAPPSAAIPQLFLLAPLGATSLVYVDLELLRSSPLVSQLLLLAPPPDEDQEYREFVSATGFDYSRDLDRALIATRLSNSAASSTAFADGRFNREKIATYALRSGKLDRRHGDEIYVFSWGPAKTVSLAFLAPGRIAIASSPAADFAVATRPAQDLPPDLRERLLRVAGSALIVLARVDTSQENFSLFGFRSRDLNKLLRNARWLTLAARPDGDHLKIALEAECVSMEAARELARAAETFRLLGRVLLSDARAHSQLSPQAVALADVILRNGEFIQNDQRVQLRLELSAAVLAGLASSSASERSTPARFR